MDELVELPLGKTNHPIWVAEAAGQPKDLGGKRRKIGYDANVTRGDGGSLQPSDDNFLEGVPLIVGPHWNVGIYWRGRYLLRLESRWSLRSSRECLHIIPRISTQIHT